MKLTQEAVRETIHSTGWSDLVWSRKLQVTYQTVWGWRNGRRLPHRRNIEAIAKVLGREVVFSDDEKMCEFRKPVDELPRTVLSLLKMMRWDHWTTEDGRQMRFDRSTGEMQEYDGERKRWVTLGNNSSNSQDHR